MKLFALTSVTGARGFAMCHVLIIEDELLVALEIRHMLADCGATSFDIAETEADAIKLATERRPKFISSDVQLSAGTGPNAVRAIYEQLGEIPVIFVTGSPELCRPCNPPGRILSKPLNDGQIAQAFKEMVAA